MRRDALILDSIRRGRAPDAASVHDIAGADAARLGDGGVEVARAVLASEVLGLGPLEPCLADPAVTDVLVNGDGSVWVDRGGGVAPAGLELDPSTARRLAVRLAALAGRRLDESQAWVDGLLPNGIRLHAILPPLVDGGAHVSLRVPRVPGTGLAGLRATGMFDEGVEDLLRAVVQARCSFVVTGGTGSGKTTLLAAMLAEVPVGERIVIVEDVRELAVAHPHVVRLQGRGANVEGQGAVGLVDLVRQALRMRPDRLVVGEVRGAEVREMLAALNTGHEGGCGTLHANAPADVPRRFDALGALAAMPRDAVQTQLASAVQVVVHVDRVAGGWGRSGRAGGGSAVGGSGADGCSVGGHGVGGRRVASLSVLRWMGSEAVCDLGVDAPTGRRGSGWDQLALLIGSGP